MRRAAGRIYVRPAALSLGPGDGGGDRPPAGYTPPITITIELPPEAADTLARKAADAGRDVAGYVRHLALRETGADGGAAGAAPLPDGFRLGTDAEAPVEAAVTGKT